MEEVIAKEGASSTIPTHPAGQFAARCIDLIDYGEVEMTYQGQTRRKHRICLRFWCGQTGEGEDGPMPLWVDCFFTLTLTLDERGNLRPFLQSWRGKPFTAEELKGFNVAVLVGVDALVQVSHAVKGDRTYANIDSAMRLPPGMESPGDLDGYVRVKDRAPEEAARESYNDDTLPF